MFVTKWWKILWSTTNSAG